MHPYTKALLSAIPVPDPEADRTHRMILEGDLPSPAKPPRGCRFHTRCPFVTDLCREKEPEGVEYLPNQIAYCHHIPEINTLPVSGL